MTDDRFEDPNVYKKFEGDRFVTLEETLKKALEEGRVKDLLPILNLLPESKREHYREIYKQALEKRK